MVFSSRRPVGKIHLEFLFMHQRHMSDRKKREIFVEHSLKTQEEKAKEEQKFQRISTDLS